MRGFWSVLRRVTPSMWLLRAVVWVTGVALALLAVPESLRTPPVVLATVVLAGCAAAAPDSPWVSVVAYAAVLTWVLATTTGSSVTTFHVVGIAVALYLHHTSAALAALVPPDAVLPWRALRSWALRCVAVLLAAAVVSAGALAASRWLGTVDSTWLPLAGFGALVLAGYGLVRLARSPGSSPPTA